MPQLGLTMTEGVITKWLKAEGEPVQKGEPLYEVETDKLTNVVESEDDGVLLQIVAAEGEEVPVQGLLAYIGEPGEAVLMQKAEAELENDLGQAEALKAEAAKEAEALQLAAATIGAAQGTDGRIKASPLAKKIAAAEGVELALLAGSGPNGRIVADDVVRAAAQGVKVAAAKVEAQAEAAAEVQKAAAQPAAAKTAGQDAPGTRRERMSAMRRAIAKNMKLSVDTSPVVHYNVSADVTELAALKAKFAENGTKVSYTDILVKLVAIALTEYPYLNCSVDGDDVIYHDYVNMGVAVGLEDGLVVPVLHDAERKGITKISAEVRDLAKRAKEGGLTPDEMHGSTFTITNLGMFGMESFTPIINQPEVAILGVNSIVKTPCVVDGEVVVRPKMTLSLTADHRVVDGTLAAKFLQRICQMIEQPWKALL